VEAIGSGGDPTESEIRVKHLVVQPFIETISERAFVGSQIETIVFDES
jgi:hypothetical protein